MYSELNWSVKSLHRNELTRAYEPLQPFFLLRLAELTNANLFIDVGANIGVYSLFFSTQLGIDSIYAYEAAPNTFRELQANITLNSQDKKILGKNLAVSSADGEVSFAVISDLSGANCMVSTSIHSDKQFKEVIRVPAVRLDSEHVLENAKLVMKIDVEGHEREVLSGTTKLLTKNQALIQLEDYGETKESPAHLLKELGYFQLAKIGPDCYFTNFRNVFSEKAIVNAFQSATESLIHSNKQLAQNACPGPEPTRKTLPCGIKLEFSGKSQAILRRIRRPFTG